MPRHKHFREPDQQWRVKLPLNLTGAGSTNTFSNNFSGNATTSDDQVLSGSYIFIAGGPNGTDEVGTFTIAGATVTFNGGLRYYDNAGGTTAITSGTLSNLGQFDPGESQTAGTTITINVSGGLFDQSGQAQNLNFGNSGNKASVTTDIFNLSGTGTFQEAVTSGGGNAMALGTTGSNQVVAFNQSGGTARWNSTIASAGAPGAGSTTNFNWTGGTLTALGYNAANLTSNDGVSAAAAGTLFQATGGGNPTAILAPGDFYLGTQYTGKTTITGNYTIDSGAVAINLGGTTAATGFHTTAADYDNVSRQRHHDTRRQTESRIDQQLHAAVQHDHPLQHPGGRRERRHRQLSPT